jgi:hypothetical protein
MWDRTEQLEESGEYQMERVRVVCFHVQSSEGGSTHLCRWRIDCLASVNKIDYVLTHTWLWGPANLVASTVAELDDTPPYLTDVHYDSVGGTHGCPAQLFDSRHELWPLMVSVWLMCVMLSSYYGSASWWKLVSFLIMSYSSCYFGFSLLLAKFGSNT